MSKLPSMPLFPADFFADTAHISDAAAHAYLFLLGHAWLREGKLFDDDGSLARMSRTRGCHWQRIKGEVMAFWELGNDGFWRNKRLTKEWNYVNVKREQNRVNGKKRGKNAKEPRILQTLNTAQDKSTTYGSSEILELKSHCYHERHLENNLTDSLNAPNSLNLNDTEKAKGSFLKSEWLAPTLTLIRDSSLRSESIIPNQDSQTETIDQKSKKLKTKSETPIKILSAALSDKTAQDVIDHRKALRKPLTARAAQGLVDAFNAFGDPERAAEAMIVNGWQGFKPEWLSTNGHAKPNGHRGPITAFSRPTVGDEIAAFEQSAARHEANVKRIMAEIEADKQKTLELGNGKLGEHSR